MASMRDKSSSTVVMGLTCCRFSALPYWMIAPPAYVMRMSAVFYMYMLVGSVGFDMLAISTDCCMKCVAPLDVVGLGRSFSVANMAMLSFALSFCSLLKFIFWVGGGL